MARNQKSNKVNEEVHFQHIRCNPFGVFADGKHTRKGVRRMPRLLQAMKDVISCDKPRRGANGL